MSLETNLQYVPKISAEKYQLLHSELDIKTLEDALYYFPNRYVDKTRLYKVSELKGVDAEVLLMGQITQLHAVGKNRGKRWVAQFQDDSGSIDLVWFRAPKWLLESIKLHTPVRLFGKISTFGNALQMTHPEMTFNPKVVASDFSFYPIYPSTDKLTKKGVSQRFYQSMMSEILQKEKGQIQEILPLKVIAKHQLMSREEALRSIHFPKNLGEVERARFRLKFEEIFFFQLSYSLKNLHHKQTVKGNPFEKVGTHFLQFYEDTLPFDLTQAQKRVVKEIRSDLRKPIQMNRLLQGDVGSGKTIVALLAMLIAKDNGFQSTLMAPTEVLATQHYHAFKELLISTELKIALLTGSTTKAERKAILTDLIHGDLDILVGTHALIEEKVQFHNLGLAVIDEQHKFGVKQRSKLWKKNKIPPHILVMTATPIPRTLALSYYSDLDLSIIDELPKGRKPILTVHQTDANRLKVFQFAKNEIDKGRQVYIVYPLIEESQQLDFKNLMDGYESVNRFFPKPGYQISIVHGKMKAEDKEFEMQRFKQGKTQIMISTTVIEVGVNVPNASVMIIESAQKFGLSQLHQLRGRVGRGSDKSYCILMTDAHFSETAKKRIDTMVQTQNGFEISEIDLEMRGPGTILGTQQSGGLGFKISSLTEDKEMFVRIRSEIDILLQEDPQLQKMENQSLKAHFESKYKEKILWSRIS